MYILIIYPSVFLIIISHIKSELLMDKINKKDIKKIIIQFDFKIIIINFKKLEILTIVRM